MASPKKLSVYIMVPATCVGGVAARSAKWAHQFASNGHNVKVVIWEDVSSPYAVKVEQQIFESLQTQWIKFDSLDKISRSAKSLAKQISFDNSSIVISGAWKEGCALANEIRSKGKTLIYLESIVGDDETNYQRAIESAPFFDAALSLGNRIKNNLKKRLPEQYKSKPICAVSPGSKVPELFPERSREDAIRICYVGRLDPVQKRIFDLAEIAQELAKRKINFHFDIIGGGNEQQTLMELFKKNNVSDYTTFHGKLPFEIVQKKLLDNDVFLLPSAYEGFSGALCEAMASGLVPVATRISGTEDVVVDSKNGKLIEVGDIKGFADAVELLQNNRDELETYSFNAWKTATEELSIVSVIKKVEDLIFQLNENPVSYQKNESESPISLNSSWVPNFVARTVRKLWRAYKGRPSDITIESWRKSKAT